MVERSGVQFYDNYLRRFPWIVSAVRLGNLENHFWPITLKQNIPKIYKRQFLEAFLFGWIRGQKTLVESLTVQQSIEAFYKDTGIDESEFPIKDCFNVYNRMTQENYDSIKTAKKE